MLDAFIIDQIRRREDRQERWQPRLEIPVPGLEPLSPPDGWRHDSNRDARDRDARDRDGEESNGVIILDM
ncbi:MAG: hypothetical protein EXR79_04185 [Myxococcales bacterium]|nr:hypothetical protein [Myxococcales bacterium]